MTDLTDHEEDPLNKALEDVQPRPWVRYWARLFDIYLFSLIVGVAAIFISPALLEGMNDALLTVLLVFAWVFVESVLLATVGTTPGKALLRIKISRGFEPDISFSAALDRSVKVWVRGMGLGIPIVALVTMVYAYRRLTEDGVTTWDRDSGFMVQHEQIGFVRVGALVVFLGLNLFLIVLAGAQGA